MPGLVFVGISANDAGLLSGMNKYRIYKSKAPGSNVWRISHNGITLIWGWSSYDMARRYLIGVMNAELRSTE